MSLNHYTPSPSNVLFIDANYLKSITPLNHNVDETIIRPCIMMSQDKYLLPILGSSLMGQIKEQVGNGTITSYTANTLVLEEFMQQTLAYWTMYEMMPHLVFRLQSKGVEKKNSDNSVSPTIEEITFLQNNYKSTAMFYSQRLSQFLKENLILYPMYSSPQSGIDVMNPNASSYPGGSSLYVPGASNNQKPGVGLGISRDPSDFLNFNL